MPFLHILSYQMLTTTTAPHSFHISYLTTALESLALLWVHPDIQYCGIPWLQTPGQTKANRATKCNSISTKWASMFLAVIYQCR